MGASSPCPSPIANRRWAMRWAMQKMGDHRPFSQTFEFPHTNDSGCIFSFKRVSFATLLVFDITMKDSVYRLEFDKDTGTCKHCGKAVSTKKSSSMQNHLKIMHKDVYDNLQKKPAAPSTLQNNALNFPVVKPSNSMNDFITFCCTTTFSLHLIKNKYFKVTFFVT